MQFRSDDMPEVLAHPDDSLALAEHIPAIDLEAQLHALGEGTSPGIRLRRAWLYNEYAMATPEFDGDDECFEQSRYELKHIIEDPGLAPRHQIKFVANMLLRYENTFRRRARLRELNQGTRKDLQEKMGHMLLQFLGEDELTSTEYGQVSELVAATYLLNGEHYPFLASWREEANMRQADNHDLYTLHTFANGRVKKAPGSVKFRQIIESDLVVPLVIGHLTEKVIRNVPPYNRNSLLLQSRRTAAQAWAAHAWTTRLAADIMVCHITGETLSDEDQEVMQLLTRSLQSKMTRFAANSPEPDYASNAELLRQEIAMRKQRALAGES